MEVVETKAEGLTHNFKVKVPASELDAKLMNKIEEVKGQIHLKGFRPGKAPVSFLKKMYGKDMMGELVQETINEATQKALTENNLQPAMPPHPHMDSEMEDVLAGKADLEYHMHVEVLPEIEAFDPSTLKLEKMIADIPQEEIDKTLNELAENNRTYKARGKTAKAKDKDRLLVDFVGRVDDEEFEGGKAEDAQLVLGSGQFIPGFEEQLVGVKTGEEKTIKVTFPEDYQAANLAGKEAEFDVTIKEVQAPEKVEINDEMAKQLGFDDLEALTKTVSEKTQERYNNQSRMHLKRKILDALDEAHDFELPKSMVDAEFEQIWQQVQNAELDEEDKDKSEEELKEEYKKIAERRVRLGLVLAELGKANEVDVPQEDMNRALQMQAMQAGISVQQLAEFYQQNPQAIQQLRAPIFEDKVVDFIIEKAEVTEKSVSVEELMEDPEE
ncbi:MAG: trigger factor [bacterium]